MKHDNECDNDKKKKTINDDDEKIVKYNINGRNN